MCTVFVCKKVGDRVCGTECNSEARSFKNVCDV